MWSVSYNRVLWQQRSMIFNSSLFKSFQWFATVCTKTIISSKYPVIFCISHLKSEYLTEMKEHLKRMI